MPPAPGVTAIFVASCASAAVVFSTGSQAYGRSCATPRSSHYFAMLAPSTSPRRLPDCRPASALPQEAAKTAAELSATDGAWQVVNEVVGTGHSPAACGGEVYRILLFTNTLKMAGGTQKRGLRQGVAGIRDASSGRSGAPNDGQPHSSAPHSVSTIYSRSRPPKRMDPLRPYEFSTGPLFALRRRDHSGRAARHSGTVISGR